MYRWLTGMLAGPSAVENPLSRPVRNFGRSGDGRAGSVYAPMTIGWSADGPPLAHPVSDVANVSPRRSSNWSGDPPRSRDRPWARLVAAAGDAPLAASLAPAAT